MTRTVAKVLQERLRDYGVQHIFGIVGRESSAISFDEVEGIDFILTRHEFTASVMAGVLASLTNQPQACFATLGPGMTNLCTGVGTAMLDRFPLIALSAQSETYDCYPNETHQCLDNTAVMGPITKYTAQLQRAEDIVALIDTAVAQSIAEPTGPSFISLPIDLLKAEFPAAIESALAVCHPTPGTTVSPSLAQNKVGEVADLVAKAAHPILVVSVSAVRAGAAESIRALVERLQIPVVTTYGAKGVLPHDHPLNYGAVSAYLDCLLDFPATEHLLGPVDMILAVGYDYAEDLRAAEWATGKEKVVVRVGSVANPVPQKFHPDVDLVTDLVAFVKLLDNKTAEIAAKIPHDIEPLRERIIEFLADPTVYQDGMRVHQIINVMNSVLNGATLVSDIGFFRHYAGLFAKIDKPNGFITSAGCSSFGFGLPAAMAATLAHPDEKVFLISGDGGFHSSSSDLETAARLGLDIVIVVVNNNRNGLIELYQNIGQGRSHPPIVEFTHVDFVQLAQANGCQAMRASDPATLVSALRHANELRGPVMVDVLSAYDFHASSFDVLAQVRRPSPASRV